MATNPEITSIVLPLPERALADALAASLGVSRSRLMRAALLTAANVEREALRYYLGQLPGPRERA